MRKNKTMVEPGFSDISKIALGPRSVPNEPLARSMVMDAMRMACYVKKLNEAADLMEEAFNNWPKLREEYASKVTLWRKGISGG
jgi:serine/threonine-protein kinase